MKDICKVNWDNPKQPYIEINGNSGYALSHFFHKKPSRVQIEDDTIRVWFEEETLVNGEVPEKKRLIEQVEETTRGRRDNFGRPMLNFFRIGSFWHDYLAGLGKLSKDSFISPEDVAFMMVLFKIARAEHSYQDDNLLDGMGYLDCLDNMHRQMKELGYPEGLQTLHTMSIEEMGRLGGKLTAK